MDEAEPRTIVFSVEGPIARSDLDGLSRRLCALLERSGARLALCDVGDVAPDAVTIEALARLQLVARRRGCRLRILDASQELLHLVAFMGLTDVVPR